MSWTGIFILIMVAIGMMNSAHAARVTEIENGLLVLNKFNFQDELLSSALILVEFYAPWCPHCKIMTDTIETLALRHQNNSDIQFAKVDVTREMALGEQVS